LWAALIIPLLLVSAWYLRNLLVTGNPWFFGTDRGPATQEQVVRNSSGDTPLAAVADSAPAIVDPGEPAETEPPATQPVANSPEAEVTVDAASAEDTTHTRLETAAASVSYVVHVCSFRTPQRVASFRRLLNDEGVPVFDQRVVIDGEPWFRVFLGPYPDNETAQRAVDSVMQDGLIRYYRILRFEDVSSS
jgi:septal ring-binding cell division protein DamX